MPHIIVGTAGHRSRQDRAREGADRNRRGPAQGGEERGITIDIGFANLRLDDRTTIGFIDVPGHERFVKNMLAGVAASMR